MKFKSLFTRYYFSLAETMSHQGKGIACEENLFRREVFVKKLSQVVSVVSPAKVFASPSEVIYTLIQIIAEFLPSPVLMLLIPAEDL